MHPEQSINTLIYERFRKYISQQIKDEGKNHLIGEIEICVLKTKKAGFLGPAFLISRFNSEKLSSTFCINFPQFLTYFLFYQLETPLNRIH